MPNIRGKTALAASLRMDPTRKHMVVAPYGGRLVDGEIHGPEAERRISDIDELPLLRPSVDHIYDTEKIAIGAYSPLEGFQGQADFERARDSMELPDGNPWSMPIFLAPGGKDNETIVAAASPSDELAIADLHGRPFALLSLEEKFAFDPKEYAEKVYRTTDVAHPNVGDLKEFGRTALAGKVRMLRRLDLPSARFELSPRETRAKFEERGWKGVAGYQARNPPHTAHEYLQRLTIEREDVDGILIHPVVGKLKKGDYKPEVIMRAYEAFVAHYYRPERAILASFSITMRYAGPRAALFYAIVRRNYGCSHYIVGRDQAGVGTYYDPFDCHRIFDGRDIGVIPLRYQETFHCTRCGGMVSTKVCPHPKEARLSTSQTKIRQLLTERKPLPPEILRPEVAEVLMDGDVIND